LHESLGCGVGGSDGNDGNDGSAFGSLDTVVTASTVGTDMPRFTFTRLQYASGNWDVDQRMPANLLHSLAEYTTIDLDPRERVVPLASTGVFDARFAYMAGHRLVEFTAGERANFVRFVRGGGFVFADDCNHDVDGLFARSFEAQMAALFGPEALQKLPKGHELYRAFFDFPDGPPTTGLELNGWGD